MDKFPPTSLGSAQDVAGVCVAYAQEAEPLGSVPLPVDMKGKGKVAAKAVKGEGLRLLMDKLGERLAFEPTSTRLYEALIAKHEAFDSFPGGPSRKELDHIRQEES